MARPQLKIYFDIVSPFAYIGCHIVTNSKIFKHCDVTMVPAFLGGIMKYCGNTAPLFIKNKDKWINLERLRWAETFGVPVNEQMPDGFPVKTISIMRHFCALSVVSQSHVQPTALAMWNHLFVERKSVEKPEDFLPVFEQVLGKEMTSKVAAEAGTAGKDLLTKNTDKAIEDGAFGMPWYVATNAEGKTEAFWGVDHLGQVIRHLDLDRTAAQGESGWRSMM